MTGRSITLTLGLCLSFSMFSASANAGQPDPAIGNWQTDLRKAHRIATAQNKEILIVFGSENCIFCRKMEKVTLSERSTAAVINRSFVPVYLDFSKNRKAAELLSVEALPTTVVVDRKAALLGKAEGFLSPAKMQKLLSNSLATTASVRPASAP